jgi:hypothetical protein
MPGAEVARLLGPLPIPKLRQLGGKFGDELMRAFGIATVGEFDSARVRARPLPFAPGAVGVGVSRTPDACCGCNPSSAVPPWRLLARAPAPALALGRQGAALLGGVGGAGGRLEELPWTAVSARCPGAALQASWRPSPRPGWRPPTAQTRRAGCTGSATAWTRRRWVGRRCCLCEPWVAAGDAAQAKAGPHRACSALGHLLGPRAVPVQRPVPQTSDRHPAAKVTSAGPACKQPLAQQPGCPLGTASRPAHAPPTHLSGACSVSPS